MKKFFITVLTTTITGLMLTGCGGASSSKDITVVSREDGSGTRGAFVELFGIEEKDSNGKKIDKTTQEASITNSTSVMISTVQGDENAIGYISLGVLDNRVKGLEIDGVKATADNVKNGSYKISRPFNIATKGEVSEVAKDFINYILSKDGQKIVEDNGYISENGGTDYTSTKPSGKIVVAGSSSVSPVMEKLKEAYLKVNTNATIEIQTSDSTTGMSATADGLCDIGMASRELKDSEKNSGLKEVAIALDGIAVIVNTDNDVNELSSDDVKNIYTGETKTWEEVNKK
ncbi:substrate-binding domain-containing protein [uncultured Clostridium sp.]|uniref:substrate-binding domain-containing protein n=1 Tax=uncultured Clostridium sp. TaxID=59620 RepID=UPI003453D88F